MNAWRNILTALWCAMLGGQSAYLLYGTLGVIGQMGAGFSELPALLTIMIVLLGVFCVCAFAALIYVPALIGSVVAIGGITAIIVYLFSSSVSGFSALLGTGPLAMLQLIVISALIAVGSLGFVLWDRSHRTAQRTVNLMPEKEF